MNIITLDPTELEPRQNYLLILGMVVPRPIAMISTISADGSLNLAPFSFFQAVSANPPGVIFSPTRDRHGQIKHSLRNVQESGEFVVAMVTEDMAEAMNLTSAEFPDGVSEFEQAGFTPTPSDIVKPRLVLESPVNLECRVHSIVEMSKKPLSGAIVIGEVVRMHIHLDVFDHEKMVIDRDKYDVISRLGGSSFGRIADSFEMPRPQFDDEGKVIPGSYFKREE